MVLSGAKGGRGPQADVESDADVTFLGADRARLHEPRSETGTRVTAGFKLPAVDDGEPKTSGRHGVKLG